MTDARVQSALSDNMMPHAHGHVMHTRSTPLHANVPSAPEIANTTAFGDRAPLSNTEWHANISESVYALRHKSRQHVAALRTLTENILPRYIMNAMDIPARIVIEAVASYIHAQGWTCWPPQDQFYWSKVQQHMPSPYCEGVIKSHASLSKRWTMLCCIYDGRRTKHQCTHLHQLISSLSLPVNPFTLPNGTQRADNTNMDRCSRGYCITIQQPPPIATLIRIVAEYMRLYHVASLYGQWKKIQTRLPPPYSKCRCGKHGLRNMWARLRARYMGHLGRDAQMDLRHLVASMTLHVDPFVLSQSPRHVYFTTCVDPNAKCTNDTCLIADGAIPETILIRAVVAFISVHNMAPNMSTYANHWLDIQTYLPEPYRSCHCRMDLVRDCWLKMQYQYDGQCGVTRQDVLQNLVRTMKLPINPFDPNDAPVVDTRGTKRKNPDTRENKDATTPPSPKRICRNIPNETTTTHILPVSLHTSRDTTPEPIVPITDVIHLDPTPPPAFMQHQNNVSMPSDGNDTKLPHTNIVVPAVESDAPTRSTVPIRMPIPLRPRPPVLSSTLPRVVDESTIARHDVICPSTTTTNPATHALLAHTITSEMQTTIRHIDTIQLIRNMPWHNTNVMTFCDDAYIHYTTRYMNLQCQLATTHPHPNTLATTHPHPNTLATTHPRPNTHSAPVDPSTLVT